MFAIVDIETTGGNSKQHKITEIAVCIHNGEKVLSTYETLVNPETRIPNFITSLTGISDEMVKNAPTFDEIADELYEILHGKIFVAHNVGFDYGFIKNHFSNADINYQSKRLCTVRLSRKIFPGLKSYSLGNLAQGLKISNLARHRAMGDCAATAEIFTLLVKNDKEDQLAQQLKRKSGETRIPSHLELEKMSQLPEKQGIYYFKNKDNKVIYVGKSMNIKKRALEHFTLNSSTQRRKRFIKEIHDVEFTCFDNELITALMECHEIKRLWPKYNTEFKKRTKAYGLYAYEDQNGAARIYVNKLLHKSKPELVFGDYITAFNFLKEKTLAFELCPKRFGIQPEDAKCMLENCAVKCHTANAKEYTMRSQKLLLEIRNSQPSMAIRCSSENQEAFILIEKGHYKGWGYANNQFNTVTIESLKEIIAPYKENGDVHRIIQNHIEKGKVEITILN